MMTDETGVIRNPARRFTGTLLVLIVAATAFTAVTSESILRRLAFFALFFASLAYRAFRSGLSWSATGVTAKDEVRTKTSFTWPEIDHFEERGLGGIGVVLANGRWVRLIYYATLGDTSPETVVKKLEHVRLSRSGES